LSLSQPLHIVNNIRSDTWWSYSACCIKLWWRNFGLFQARGFLNVVANLRQSKSTTF